MDDADVDLLDTRGRLRRLALATSIGAVVTLLVMRLIESVSSPVSNDPVSPSAILLLAVGMFVVTTALGLNVIARLRRA
jgi:hypothetical protein